MLSVPLFRLLLFLDSVGEADLDTFVERELHMGVGKVRVACQVQVLHHLLEGGQDGGWFGQLQWSQFLYRFLLVME